MASSRRRSVGRRGFLKHAAAGAAAGAAALVSAPPAAEAQAPQGQAAPATPPEPGANDVYTTDRPGSDFMVDVIKSLGIEYIAANPGSSFRGLQESMVNYGGNTRPELLTCLHEESSVAMAHGYAKIEGKPMAVIAHGTVGLQHASMAVYNAYATACRCTSCSATSWTPQPARGASGPTACRMRSRWCATSSSGTTRRCRLRTSPSPPCAPRS